MSRASIENLSVILWQMTPIDYREILTHEFLEFCKFSARDNLRGESVENIDMDFLAYLAFFGSKLIIKIKKNGQVLM